MNNYKVGQRLRLTNNIMMNSRLEVGDVCEIVGTTTMMGEPAFFLHFGKDLDNCVEREDANQICAEMFISLQFEVVEEPQYKVGQILEVVKNISLNSNIKEGDYCLLVHISENDKFFLKFLKKGLGTFVDSYGANQWLLSKHTMGMQLKIVK